MEHFEDNGRKNMEGDAWIFFWTCGHLLWHGNGSDGSKEKSSISFHVFPTIVFKMLHSLCTSSSTLMKMLLVMDVHLHACMNNEPAIQMTPLLLFDDVYRKELWIVTIHWNMEKAYYNEPKSITRLPDLVLCYWGHSRMEENWEYADADTQYHVHGMHLYPARMIPQIANRLIIFIRFIFMFYNCFLNK